MSEYPVPSYAASIWVAGDQLWLSFPPLGNLVQGHSVPFPATDKGMALILQTLRERGTLQGIGTKGSPTRYQVERTLAQDKRYNGLLEAMREAKKAEDEKRQESIEFLKELGL